MQHDMLEKEIVIMCGNSRFDCSDVTIACDKGWFAHAWAGVKVNGVSCGFSTKFEAINEAIKQCRKKNNGNLTCKWTYVGKDTDEYISLDSYAPIEQNRE